MLQSICFILGLAFAPLFSNPTTSHDSIIAQETGIKVMRDSSTILLGSSIPLSGTNKYNGTNIKLGIETYLARVNDLRLLNKKIQYIALDDQYNAKLAVENVRRLIEKDEVLALIGNSGSPSNLIALSVIKDDKAILFAPFTGANFLYKIPPDRSVFTFRSSYEIEIGSMLKGLLEAGYKLEDIAFFTSQDAFGELFYNVALEELKKLGLIDGSILPHGTFNPESMNIEQGLSTIVVEGRKTKAVIMGGTTKRLQKFITLAVQEFSEMLFVVNTVASDLVHEDLPPQAKVVMAQVLPLSANQSPTFTEYKNDLKKYFPNEKISQISFFYYLATKVLIIGIQRAIDNNQLSREGLINALESLRDIDIGIGYPITFSPTDHQAFNQIWFAKIEKGHYVPFEWKDIRK